MKQIERLESLGLFDARVPRYTSYPTAPVFSTKTGAAFQHEALAGLDPAEAVSVYLHIPFCERLCWFCACRTQGTKTLSPVESYLDALEAELAIVRDTIPEDLRMGRLHWGGGTPTILPPQMIHRLAEAVKRVFPPIQDWEFSVEIDPTMVDRAKIAALAEQGMNRASIGIQDFDPVVQAAIGREQPFDVTRACVDDLRAAGVTSLNTDLVYGLPHQSQARQADTVAKVLTLDPDRVALFGYAHVPWMSKRQKLIDEAALPGDHARHALARLAGARFEAAGMTPIGIDHFAKAEDDLARAQQEGRLRRNFQGYTADDCATLIGLGASSISRLPGGYLQNAPATAAYSQRVAAGILAGTKGHVLTEDDRLRGRAIEMLMCDFRIDRAALERDFGPAASRLDPTHSLVAAQYADYVVMEEGSLSIQPEGKPLTRIIASAYDAYIANGARYSQAS
ncbi:oxygen-independent coproporphyrinogen III oxidase [Sinisalibacter lacisalsi]|uniref:Coproporphyrinogen-III oxidase n=1 Tax=Sinisalibacter lacisalsi TaxID=1526570 RepID=A0ABQ1QL91_9RHOB|nr:oxygen-independent coproporphyrinogen III oxidase [Sinisalibacter lacisalsi]GGD29833.1 coproporphyrinogen III oxidase, anaerobic 1 [Sinisalibacter lacisalsi]